MRPLTPRELRIYLWLVHFGMTVAEVRAAQAKAIAIIGAMEATGMPVDPNLR